MSRALLTSSWFTLFIVITSGALLGLSTIAIGQKQGEYKRELHLKEQALAELELWKTGQKTASVDIVTVQHETSLVRTESLLFQIIQGVKALIADNPLDDVMRKLLQQLEGEYEKLVKFIQQLKNG